MTTRQIYNPAMKLINVGDYVIADITRRGKTDRCLILRYSSDASGVYCQTQLFDGSREPLDARIIRKFPKLAGFGYSWIMSWVCSLEDALYDLGARGHIVTENLDIDFSPRDYDEEDEDEQEENITSFFSDNYTREEIYTGITGYHDHHDEWLNVPRTSYKYRIGVELEVEFPDSSSKEDFVESESNWFFMERDGSLGDYGTEIITIPLLPWDAKNLDFWTPLTEALTFKDARSWDTGRCGLHVHIGREILGATENESQETLGKMLFFYHHFLKDTWLNRRIYGRDVAYNDRDCKTVEGTGAACFSKEILHLKSVQEKVKDAMISRAHDSRYFDINIENNETIEFRKGRGSINAKRIVAVVEWSELICQYSKETPWTQLSYDDFVKFAKYTCKSELLKGYFN